MKLLLIYLEYKNLLNENITSNLVDFKNSEDVFLDKSEVKSEPNDKSEVESEPNDKSEVESEPNDESNDNDLSDLTYTTTDILHYKDADLDKFIALPARTNTKTIQLQYGVEGSLAVSSSGSSQEQQSSVVSVIYDTAEMTRRHSKTINNENSIT